VPKRGRLANLNGGRRVPESRQSPTFRVTLDQDRLTSSTMAAHGRDFAAEVAAEELRLNGDRSNTVCRLRGIYEAWFRHLLGLELDGELAVVTRKWAQPICSALPGPGQRCDLEVELTTLLSARTCLAGAERCQWEIGTWSTGSGEGLASMGEVRTLQTAHAWLALATSRVQEALALALAVEVEGDPNQIGEEHRESLHELRELARR
jgi:hypothetical protein